MTTLLCPASDKYAHSQQANSHPCQKICLAWDQTNCRQGSQPGLACCHPSTIGKPLQTPPTEFNRGMVSCSALLIDFPMPHSQTSVSIPVNSTEANVVKNVKGTGPPLLAEKTDAEQHTYLNPSLSLHKYQ